MTKNNRRRILLPAMALLLALDITVTGGMLSNGDTLDLIFGKGRQTVISTESAKGTNTDYYTQLYNSSSESKQAASKVSKQISDEGVVLLKNNGILPLSNDCPISPMGLRYFDPYYCGTGSSAISTEADDVVTPAQGLRMVFTNINTALEQAQLSILSTDTGLVDNPYISVCRPANGGSIDAWLYEFDASVLTGLEASCRDSVAVVYIGRRTGENQDAHTGVYDDGTPHMLALTRAEKNTLDFAKAICKEVVVILSSSSAMQIPELEDDPGIGAILWIGGAGSTGYASVADILVGSTIPSGRTPTVFASDFKKDPTFANQDDGSDAFVYTNAYTTLITSTDAQSNVNTPFREYEEGVYLGYKYYETAYDIGFLKDYYSRTNGVVYPFGYGLSYTNFSQKIVKLVAEGEQISITVLVRNEGDLYAGKDVVQLYVTPPYSHTDVHLGIEKPTASLLRFAKTDILEPGESENVTLTFSLDDLASYCYTRNNGDGTTGCYVLTAGEYEFSLRSNSHDVLDTCVFDAILDRWFNDGAVRTSDESAQSTMSTSGNVVSLSSDETAYTIAVNRFPLISKYMTDPETSNATVLTRSDWASTQPTAPTDRDRIASDTVVQAIALSNTMDYDLSTDPNLGNSAESYVYSDTAPVSKANNGLVLADLRGKYYDDPMWDLLLDQLDYSDTEALRQCLFEAAYQTGALPEIGKPRSVEYDGPQGLTLADVSGKNWLDNMCGYPAAPVMSATWNTELMYEFGYMIGQEALTADINGWYAPGLNIIRSPFCGRTSEYYSEDPVLSGYLGASVISGAGDSGLSCSIKHFALMETEMHRSAHTCTWMTEQALREVYLKSFEIAIKNARKTIRYTGDDNSPLMSSRTMRAADFIMAGDSAIGTEWSAGNYALLTEVLRNEWGFKGTVISDMHIVGNSNIIDKLLRSGCDTFMSSKKDRSVNASDYTSPTGQSLIRGAVKNLCYTLVNSNLMQGVSPDSVFHSEMSQWMLWLLICNAAVAGILILCAGFCIHETISTRRQRSTLSGDR